MACISNGLIVGGGVAGLSAAIALQRIGVACDVVEIGEAPAGASLSLSGGATAALGELGIYEACAETGTPFTAQMLSPVVYDAAGEPIGAPPPPRPPAPHALPPIGVFRPVFAQVMEEHAQRLGATLRKGLTVDHIADEAGAARVTLSNGEIRRYDCVIGADGVHSRVRALLFPEARAPQYAGQMSVRWMIPGPAIPGEGWYVAAGGRLGFFHMARQNVVYAPIVFTMPDEYVTQEAAYARVKALLDEFTAPAIVNLRQYLRPDSTFICRPWRWHLVDAPWYRGRTLLIGDAAHSTTSHMGMGAGIALEDAVVLAQCIAAAPSLEQAYAAFMQRRFERVEVVAMSSLNLSRMEQAGAPEAEVAALRSQAFAKIAQPY